MKTTKRIFRFIGKLLLWIFYLIITGKERQMYQHAKYAKRAVKSVKNDLFGTTYIMGEYLGNKEPERNFLTWKEFRKQHKF
ncbi:hypothetical protein M1M25_gp016 [Tenacibaculum phage Gundel_1]|uniref:Uncharacterized protein n=1 Tax=Tenacibaculum phage Gundel_1 TaxID=2745672 RepID=A0A8E4ZDW2_9CAUD|nr:hypothetical protein M1M25_gp016 [Tenacibaculum phage Gundel_1]QQV91446.1 hypothetical protein Gundel1_16 [Tenacibaculum phage Gundel_1]